MLQCCWSGERERGREVGDVFPLQSPVQCSVPVSRACYNVTMLHFTSSQIISLFSPVRDQPGGPHSVAAFRPERTQNMDSNGGGGREQSVNKMSREYSDEHWCHISPGWHRLS